MVLYREQIIYLLPLLLFWIALPFYIGYLRGAIKFDSIVERTRGWIYLIVGVSTYAALMSATIELPHDIIFYSLYGSIFLIGFYFAIKLVGWMPSVLKNTYSSGEKIGLISAAAAAGCLSFAAAFIAFSLRALVLGIQIHLIILMSVLIMATLGLIGFVVFERVSRVMIHYSGKLNVELPAIFGVWISATFNSFMPKKFLCLLMSGLLFALVGDIIGRVGYFEATPFFLLLAIFLLLVSIFYFARYPFSRKSVYAQLRSNKNP